MLYSNLLLRNNTSQLLYAFLDWFIKFYEYNQNNEVSL